MQRLFVLFLLFTVVIASTACGREEVKVSVPDDSKLQSSPIQPETKPSDQSPQSSDTSTDANNQSKEDQQKTSETQKQTNLQTQSDSANEQGTKPNQAAGQSSANQSTAGGTAAPQVNSTGSNEGNKPAQQNTAKSSGNVISFGKFFDGDNRTTPSNKFWDMNGQQVEIKGFMGEVISMEKHWFLLIPAPGAECPFDNGNGQLWNEIMIVFVKDGDKLRYTRGPLKVKGTLDVGIKVDQSGYRTMFRLQNASYETI